MTTRQRRSAYALIGCALLGCDVMPGQPPASAADVRDAAGDSARPGDVTLEPCLTTAPTSCPEPAPTYQHEVAAIVTERCLGCHYGEIGGPWPLDSYSHMADWRDTIRSAMLDCSMPPPEERIEMTTEERMTILTWLRCDMPR